VIFNQSGYAGSRRRLISTAPTATDLAEGMPRVEASLPHAVLSRNEYGVGYYHFLFDTLASVSFLWPSVARTRTQEFS